MGNICRSPTAECVFRSLVDSHNLNDVVTTDSAGTHAYYIGNPPDPRAQAIALHHNIDLSDLIARKVAVQDFYDFVAMDRGNKLNLNAMNNNEAKASVHLFMEFAENWSNDEVPDPYYSDRSNDINGFEQVFKMLSDASQGLLKKIVMDNLNDS